MVHNGIEYGDMQMICEAYDLMQNLLGMKPAEMSGVFKQWNTGVLDSFLIEITAEVLAQKDSKSDKPLVDLIVDVAGQKGTGKWTSISALDMGVGAPTIAEAVFARCMSAAKDERVAASKVISGPTVSLYSGNKEELITAIHDALYCSKICSYAQGFELMRAAQAEYGWDLHFGEIAQIWRGGCIIRAAFLQKITEAFNRDPKLANLLLDPYFNDTIQKAQSHWREVVGLAAHYGVPVPTFSGSLCYFDSYRSARLPQNLLQGLRDFFGAHTYERLDAPRGKFFHTDWPVPGRPEIEL
jgi:6-phosphogluconate dehydrogenase